MNKVIIVGGGISGLSIAHCLKDRYDVTVLEKESCPGGLIRCKHINEGLYHTVGGHVFNSRRKDVLDWFWTFFDQEKEFIKTPRSAVISMPDGRKISYPIENHIYMLDEKMTISVIDDLLEIVKSGDCKPKNFEEFLLGRFGKTLYKHYFQPYNEKIWRKDLKEIPLSWLEGKLPMPTVADILFNNFNHVKEMNMVHSSFYYPKKNGSQFLADRLAEGLNIEYHVNVTEIKREYNRWFVNGRECDRVIFCGNIKCLPQIICGSIDLSDFNQPIENLEYHGTTSVFCEIEKNSYSWIYMPSSGFLSHRIICTGNFSPMNNLKGKMTGTIEFTDYISKEDIDKNLSKCPFIPKYLTHQYTRYTYPVQNDLTKSIISSLKEKMEKDNFYLLGRFAEWEYYNMDAAMGAAIDLSKQFL